MGSRLGQPVAPRSGQLYYDAEQERYYMQNEAPPTYYGQVPQKFTPTRFYIDELPTAASNQSQIRKMMANRQPYQYNAPNAVDLFSQLSALQSAQPIPNMGAMTPTMGMQGQYGAGRFLGGNTGLLGGNSTSMLGT